MNWLRRFFAWLLPLPIDVLLTEAAGFGDVSIQQVAGEAGIEWQASIRARGPIRYSWMACSPSIHAAVREAIIEAKENPIEAIEGAKFAPRLGGAEFDPE